MTRHVAAVLGIAGVVGVLAVGCKKDGETGGLPQPPEDPVAVLFREVDGQMAAGNTNAALATLDAAFACEDLAAQRSTVLRALLSILLTSGRVDDAKTRLLAAVPQGEGVVGPVFGMITDFLSQSASPQAQADWAGQLVALELPAALRSSAWAWRLDGLRRAGGAEAMSAAVTECMARLGAGAQQPFAWAVERAIQAKDFTAADAALKAAEADAKFGAALLPATASLRGTMLIAQADWAGLEKHIDAAAPRLDDLALADWLGQLGGAMIAQGQFALVDRVCGKVLGGLGKGPRSGGRAAEVWLQCAAQQKNGNEVSARLVKVGGMADGKTVEVGTLVSLVDRFFYDVLNTGNAEAKQQTITVAEQACAKLDPIRQADDVKRLDALLTDAAVILENYQRALELIRKHADPKNKDWQEMAENKLEAHLALQRGDKEEAVRRFRKFMEYIGRNESTMIDPVTGVRFTKDMTLGLNAKRIGDIQAEMGKPADARASYREAEGLYEKALKDASKDGPEQTVIRGKLAEIKAAEAKLAP